MPSLSSGTILVTGANSYLGVHVVGHLLQKGYHVRAAVRSVNKCPHLLKLFSNHAGRLTLAVVGDMNQNGAFNDAVRSVAGIIHIAAPALNAHDILPSSTWSVRNILESAQSHAGPTLKRIVFCSSLDAITVPANAVVPVTAMAAEQNKAAIKAVEMNRTRANPTKVYAASKASVETSIWGFFDAHRRVISFDFSIISLPCVLGPPIHEVNSPYTSGSGDTGKHIFNALVHGTFPAGMNPKTEPAQLWVDVRDAAAAHVRALETEAAGMRRLIPAQGTPMVFEDLVNSAASLRPFVYDFSEALRSIEKFQDAPLGNSQGASFDVTEDTAILGISYRSLDVTVRDIIADYARRGWIGSGS
ncbi:NAD(P)-binding protein [Coniophora puteana RWD-64-598 SS2]|uniref:NAD(P)-binding protein n=1 Tax=Coniophora puteana (strain RWD-64-598) TaxID=741705 RepID=A0A5M3MZI5_CONPW|nr:NAD(P)-binding protein [Coniophora puteana RWD-64-598 SS2]EIW84560.1 NAD(P)-binding protein [Coniophora puteana RWD-64-598 SS2]